MSRSSISTSSIQLLFAPLLCPHARLVHSCRTYVLLAVVRTKAKDIVSLIGDESRLHEERKKSKKNKDRYTGMGNPAFQGAPGTEDEPTTSSSSSSRFAFMTVNA